jgi:hypothetical protein
MRELRYQRAGAAGYQAGLGLAGKRHFFSAHTRSGPSQFSTTNVQNEMREQSGRQWSMPWS